MDFGRILGGFWSDSLSLFHEFSTDFKIPHQSILKKKGPGVLPAERLNAPGPLRAEGGQNSPLPPHQIPSSSAVPATRRPPRDHRGPHISQKKSTKKSIQILTSYFLRFFRFLVDFGKFLEPKMEAKIDFWELFCDAFFERVLESIFWCFWN